MQTSLSQLRGMIVYEFKMHWRRRSLLVLTLSMLLMALFTSLFGGESTVNMLDAVSGSSVSEENANFAFTIAVMIAVWMPLGVVLAFVLPILISDTIPLDRQYRVDELLNTLPLSPSTYLLGKLLGGWLAVLSGLALAMVIGTGSWLLQSRAFDLWLFAQTGLVVCLSLTILNGGLGLLLGASQPNRRRAIILTIIAFVIFSVFIGSSSLTLASPIRWELITYFIPIETEGLEELPDLGITKEVILTIVWGIAELIALFAMLWAWLRSQEKIV